MKALPRSAAWSPIALFILAWFAGCGSSQPPERDADAPLRASSRCSMHPERCNALDDDCDGIIDEDADSSCGLAHASSSCVKGTCVVDRCSLDYYNCNEKAFDGCETKSSCEATAEAAQSMQGGPDAPVDPPKGAPDAAAPSVATGQAAPPPGAMHTPVGCCDDADGGAPQAAGRQAPSAESDAGSCEPERCDGQDNDCDHKVDEDTTCVCAASAPTGQGADCDRCVCESCGEALAGCTNTMDDEWNTLCGDVLTCFGKSVQAGLCTGEDSDCFQNGDGPCAKEFQNAFRRGWACTADPVRTPCGGLTRVRLECYRTKCAAFCKD